MFLPERNQKEKVTDPGDARGRYSRVHTVYQSVLIDSTRLNCITHCVPRLRGFLFLFCFDEKCAISLLSQTELGPVCHNYCD